MTFGGEKASGLGVVLILVAILIVFLSPVATASSGGGTIIPDTTRDPGSEPPRLTNDVESQLVSNSPIRETTIAIDDPSEADFGDAPDPSYPTLPSSDGARHLDPTKAWLGTSVDEETAPRPTDTHDDGLWRLDPSLVEVSVTNANHSGPLYVNVLQDVDADGDWSEPEHEWVVQNERVTVPIGETHRVTIESNAGISAWLYAGLTSGAGNHSTWTRVTLTGEPLDDYTGHGEFAIGETEDYGLSTETTPNAGSHVLIPDPPDDQDPGWFEISCVDFDRGATPHGQLAQFGVTCRGPGCLRANVSIASPSGGVLRATYIFGFLVGAVPTTRDGPPRTETLRVRVQGTAAGIGLRSDECTLQIDHTDSNEGGDGSGSSSGGEAGPESEDGRIVTVSGTVDRRPTGELLRPGPASANPDADGDEETRDAPPSQRLGERDGPFIKCYCASQRTVSPLSPGHAWVVLKDGTTGKQYGRGLYPGGTEAPRIPDAGSTGVQGGGAESKNKFVTGAGAVKDDTNRNGLCFCREVSREEYQEAVDAINEWKQREPWAGKSSKYNFISRNCMDFLRYVAAAEGSAVPIETTTWGVTDPQSFYEYLERAAAIDIDERDRLQIGPWIGWVESTETPRENWRPVTSDESPEWVLELALALEDEAIPALSRFDPGVRVDVRTSDGIDSFGVVREGDRLALVESIESPGAVVTLDVDVLRRIAAAGDPETAARSAHRNGEIQVRGTGVGGIGVWMADRVARLGSTFGGGEAAYDVEPGLERSVRFHGERVTLVRSPMGYRMVVGETGRTLVVDEYGSPRGFTTSGVQRLLADDVGAFDSNAGVYGCSVGSPYSCPWEANP